MATVTAPPRVSASPAPVPGRRYDNRFFLAMAVLILLSVLVGFGPTYYFAGLVLAPLPSPIIHVHGALFTCWVLLLVVQTALVSARRVDIHRRLGVAGFCLAGLMVLAGLSASINALVDHRTRQGVDPRMFFIVPFTDMLCFAPLIFLAFWLRKDSAAHKRLILLATASLLPAAFARMRFGFLDGNVAYAFLMSELFILLLAGYDYWATRKVHRVTLLGGIWIVFVQFGRLPFSRTAVWLDFAGWIESHAAWLK